MHFRLVRYFTLTSLSLFVLAALGLSYFYRQTAVTNMLELQEATNVNLTRVFANSLWQRNFSRLLKNPEAVPIQEVHQEVLDFMRGTSTYKIKVYDLEGRTVYSSELPQIGEDKSGNLGFQNALAGKTLSELVHKDQFSAFEQIIENRDLIQTYTPRHDPVSGQIIGVFEIYSDAAPSLAHIGRTEKQLLLSVAAAFAILYLALWLIVRHAERVIRHQELEWESVFQQLAQSEKMASLGQLVAGVAHQLNTPIAFSHSNVSLALQSLANFRAPLRICQHLAAMARDSAEKWQRMDLTPPLADQQWVAGQTAREADVETIVQMLGDVRLGLEQMRELVENLRDFTHLDRNKVSDTDINASLRTVVYIARSALPPRIRISENYVPLPPLVCNPSQLNQVFLNLITNAAQAIEGEGNIRISTRHHQEHLEIEIADSGAGIAQEDLPHIFESYYTTKPKGVGTGLGLSVALDIIRSHGGSIEVKSELAHGTRFSVRLPLLTPGLEPAVSTP